MWSTVTVLAGGIFGLRGSQRHMSSSSTSHNKFGVRSLSYKQVSGGTKKSLIITQSNTNTEQCPTITILFIAMHEIQWCLNRAKTRWARMGNYRCNYRNTPFRQRWQQTNYFVLYREVVFSSEVNIIEKGPQSVSFIERLSSLRKLI